MDGMQDAHLVTDAAALRTLYGEPSDGAIAKEVNHVHQFFTVIKFGHHVHLCSTIANHRQ